MTGYRLERVSGLLKEVLGEIITDLKDPRIGFVSILDVKVSPDLRHARVCVSSFGADADRKSTIDGLTSAKGFIKREITARGVSLRHIPDLNFVYDDSIEYSTQIMDLINKANESDRKLAKNHESDPA